MLHGPRSQTARPQITAAQVTVLLGRLRRCSKQSCLSPFLPATACRHFSRHEAGGPYRRHRLRQVHSQPCAGISGGCAGFMDYECTKYECNARQPAASAQTLLVSWPAAHHSLQGFTVIDADAIARTVLDRGRWGYRRVVRAFGTGILRSDGERTAACLHAGVFAASAACASRRSRQRCQPVVCRVGMPRQPAAVHRTCMWPPSIMPVSTPLSHLPLQAR